MKLRNTALPDVLVLEPQVYGDQRGFFFETYRREVFAAAGVDCEFVQDNHSKSAIGVLRGLHYQVSQPQGKLVRAIEGAVFDVAVDLRRSSPCFGQWFGIELNEENRLSLWVPPGFAHGFLVISPTAQVVYKCTEYYAPEHERSLLWRDPVLNIKWPVLDVELTLSEKDRLAPALEQADTFP